MFNEPGREESNSFQLHSKQRQATGYMQLSQINVIYDLFHLTVRLKRFVVGYN